MTEGKFDPALIGERLQKVRLRIEKAGADPDKIKIVAVTKGFGPGAIEAALGAGFQSIGENYAQEAVAKHEALGPTAGKAEWHFVGQLQRNKVKLLDGFIDVWQSIDSAALIDVLGKRVPGASIFVQVNLTEDPGRGGCEWSEIDSLCEVARRAKLKLLGLMGVAPQAGENEVRALFRRLAAEAGRLGCSEVSMGMSGDFEIAVEEGATVIRLGSTLFGPRPVSGSTPPAASS